MAWTHPLKWRRTLHLYLLREILSPFIAILGIAVCLVAFVQLLQSADTLAGLQLPALVLLQGFLYAMIPLAGIVLPISLFFALIFVFSRLATQRELLAALTIGIPPRDFLWVPSLLGVGVGLCTFCLVCWGEPWGIARLRELWRIQAQQALTQQIKPKQLFVWEQKFALYAEGKNGNTLYDVVLVDRHNIEQPIFIFAQKSEWLMQYPQDSLNLTLRDGTLWLPGRDGEQTTVVKFARFTYPLDVAYWVGRYLRKMSPLQAMSIRELQRLSQNEAYSVSERIHAAIVWQRKLAIPLSALVFALLAIPLSWQSHAGGRPSSFIVGIVLLGGYYYGGRALELAARDQGLDLHWAVWGPNVLGILFFFLSWWHKRWHV